uniref:SMP-30/Gluconolactonase/LRE-like region domain-containing protein n=1 Tax=Alexandrium monilatum TaxID=311494 RepID=A0A7S4T7W0_9DINO
MPHGSGRSAFNTFLARRTRVTLPVGGDAGNDAFTTCSPAFAGQRPEEGAGSVARAGRPCQTQLSGVAAASGPLEGIRWYNVALPRVCVRRAPSLSRRIVSVRRRGDVCAAVEERGAWVRVLPNPGEPRRQLWMLAVGTGHGLPERILEDAGGPPPHIPSSAEALEALAAEATSLEPWSDEEVPQLGGGGHAVTARGLTRDALAAGYACAVAALFRRRCGGATRAGAAGAQRLVLEFLSPRIIRFGPPSVVAGGRGRGSRPEQLRQPGGICLQGCARQGDWTLYVCDTGNHRVMRWRAGASEGVCAAGSKAGVPGSGSRDLRLPGGCDLGADGTLYVADTHNGRIQAWPPGADAGCPVIARDGEGRRLELATPLHVRAGAGVLHVTDARGGAVHKYWLQPGSGGGSEIAANGAVLCDRSGGLRTPRGICVVRTRVGPAPAPGAACARETVYVADAFCHRVFCLEGRQIQLRVRPPRAPELCLAHPRAREAEPETAPAVVTPHVAVQPRAASAAAPSPASERGGKETEIQRCEEAQWRFLPSVGSWLSVRHAVGKAAPQDGRPPAETGTAATRGPARLRAREGEPETAPAVATPRAAAQPRAAGAAAPSPASERGGRETETRRREEAQEAASLHAGGGEAALAASSADLTEPAAEPAQRATPGEAGAETARSVQPTRADGDEPTGQGSAARGRTPVAEASPGRPASQAAAAGGSRDGPRTEAAAPPQGPERAPRSGAAEIATSKRAVWEEERPSEASAPTRAREFAGGLSATRTPDVRDLRRLPDGRFVDGSGEIWKFCDRSAADKLSEPKGVWYDVGQSMLYVADSMNGRIQRFAPGEQQAETVAGGCGRALVAPADVVLAPDGALFVSDSETDRVLRFPPIWG